MSKVPLLDDLTHGTAGMMQSYVLRQLCGESLNRLRDFALVTSVIGLACIVLIWRQVNMAYQADAGTENAGTETAVPGDGEQSAS